MACEDRSRGGLVSLSHDALRAGVPVPEQDGAVGRPGRDVAVRGDVALRAGQAGHDPVVAKDDLDNAGGVGSEHAGKDRENMEATNRE